MSRERKSLDALLIVLALVFLAHIASYFITPGQYKRTQAIATTATTAGQRPRVIPGTYQPLPQEKQPQINHFAPLVALPKGFKKGANLIFFLLVIGGSMAIIKSTGAMDAIIVFFLKLFKNHPNLLMISLLTIFSTGTALAGLGSEYLPFLPAILYLCAVMGFDSVIAIGLIYCSISIGYGCSITNPFNIINAQNVAGVPVLSGSGLRIISLILAIGIGAQHFISYAKKIKKNPELSLADKKISMAENPIDEEMKFTWVHLSAMVLFVTAIIIFIYGAEQYSWGTQEMSAIFIAMGIIVGVLARRTANEMCKTFQTGAAEMTYVALLVGVARGIMVILDDASIMDTIVFHLARLTDGLSGYTSIVAMFFTQALINFFVSSGSGQALITMPIMASLADIAGISRQTAVLAFQFGDGFSNMILPTAAVLVAFLNENGTSYFTWLRFALPLLIKLYVLALIMLYVAHITGY